MTYGIKGYLAVEIDWTGECLEIVEYAYDGSVEYIIEGCGIEYFIQYESDLIRGDFGCFLFDNFTVHFISGGDFDDDEEEYEFDESIEISKELFESII